MMSFAKRFFAGFLVLSVGFSALQVPLTHPILTSDALAEEPPQTLPAGIKGILGMEAGDYSFVTLDKTTLEKTYLEQVFKRNDADYKYFLDSIAAIEGAFISFVTQTIYGSGGLKKLSDQSTLTGTLTEASVYMEAINQFTVAKLSLETKINTITSLEGAFPSQVKIKVGEGEAREMPQYGRANFEPIKKFYSDRLTELVEFVSNLAHNVKLPNGSPKAIAKGSGEGLVLNWEGARFSPEKIAEFRKEAQKLRSWLVDPEAFDQINAYTKLQKQMVQEFIETYGSDNKFRSMSGQELANFEREAKNISIAFWSRSLIRLAYGLPIGTIGIKYNKKWFGLDKIFSRTAMSWINEPVWEEKEFIELQDDYTNILQRMNERATNVLDANVGFLATGARFLSWLGGNRNLANANQAMLLIMIADFVEERMIMRGDLIGLRSYYRKRYLEIGEGVDVTKLDEATQAQIKANKAFYNGLIKQFDPAMASDDSDNPYSVDMTSTQSLLGKYRALVPAFQKKEGDFQKAKELDAFAQNAEGVNQFAQKRKKRMEDLDK